MNTLVAILGVVASGASKTEAPLNLDLLASRDQPTINLNGRIITLGAISDREVDAITAIESQNETNVDVSKDPTGRVTHH